MGGSHRFLTPVFALYNLFTFSNSHSFHFGSASSKFLSSSFFQGLSSTCAAHLRHHFANALPILPSLLHIGPAPRDILVFFFFFLQDLHSSCPCCGLRDLMQEPSTAFRTLDHLTSHLCWCNSSIFLPLTFLFHFPTNKTIFVRSFFFFLDGATPSRSLQRQQLNKPLSILGIHPSF